MGRFEGARKASLILTRNHFSTISSSKESKIGSRGEGRGGVNAQGGDCLVVGQQISEEGEGEVLF
jgi:hypothetical protein